MSTSSTSSTSTTSTMNAWVYRKGGLPTDEGVLVLEKDFSKPKVLKNDELLIQVKAASLNVTVGWKSMSLAPLRFMHKKPAVPESDFSGIIAGGNLTGTEFNLGDEVFGITPAEVVTKTGQGTLGEFTVASSTMTVKKPKNLSFAEAACFPLAGLTAYYALVTVGGVKSASERGEKLKVFINGGSGGVGTWAIQIAKIFNCEVTVTGSKESTQLLKDLGANHFINYKEIGPLHQYLTKNYPLSENKAFDIIFDPMGDQELYAHTPQYLTKDGTYIDVFGGIHLDSLGGVLHSFKGLFNHLLRPTFLGGTPRKFKVFMLPGDKMGKELRDCAKLLEEGKLKATIAEEFDFKDVKKAYEMQISGRSKGKVVVNVNI